MIKAIETQYKNYRFRSRLEARWAVFLDTLGIEWEYEREGYDLGDPLGYYLPDFWLPFSTYYPNGGYFLEIKGQQPTDAELAKIATLAAGTGHSSWLFAGEPGKHQRYTAHRSGNFFHTDPAIDSVIECDDPHAFDLWATFSRWDFPGDVDGAIKAARSARFEHGEQVFA